MFAELLVLATTLVAPSDGAVVPLVADAQREYLAQGRAERFAKLEDAAFRKELAKTGSVQPPLRFEWTGDTNAVYTLAIDAVAGGERQVFSITNRTFARLTNFEAGKAYRWAVRAPDGSAFSARFTTAAELPRLVRAEGVRNLRDCGGWTGAGGRRVRQGRIYRSAGLRNSARKSGSSLLNVRYSDGGLRVTPDGIAELRDDLKIRTDVELRTVKEAMCMKSSVLGPEVRWVHVPFMAYDFIDDDVKGRAQFAKVFREFTEEGNYPILFHCSGGRDRTGTLAFLLNGLLGVAEDDLCRDWEATCFSEASLSFGPDRLTRLLDYLRTLPGEDMPARIESYVRSCGVKEEDIARFRELMLEPEAASADAGKEAAE